LGIFNQLFAHLLYVSIYARLQIFIQLSPTLTKLCRTGQWSNYSIIYEGAGKYGERLRA